MSIAHANGHLQAKKSCGLLRLVWLSGVVVSSLGIRGWCPGFVSRVALA